MLSELLPKSHNHHRSLSLFGPILDDFDDWLVARGYCFLTRQCYILRCSIAIVGEGYRTPYDACISFFKIRKFCRLRHLHHLSRTALF